MVLTKIEPPAGKKAIIKQSKFILNSLYPIGFKETNISGCFLFLFGAYQDYQDQYLYLQILFETENAFEYDLLKKHPNYIPNYEKDLVRQSAYKQMISRMADDNLYATDFIMTKLDDKNYYESTAIRRISFNQAEKIQLYIPMNTYLRIKIFLENLNVKSSPFPCEIFADPRFNNPTIVTIDEVKRCESAYAGNSELFLDTHYILTAGPHSYPLNYRTFINKDREIANLLNQDIFTSQYSTDYYIEYMTRDEDTVLVVFDGEEIKYEKYNLPQDEFIVVCRIPANLVEKTNFIDQNNKIYI